ncbi:hypothetical protein [uncultured Brevibacterium sp.]|uniref:hypothetical protein n=1 Tax=uncultured Brevibacterium sp. TaxID=189678 RepID=UPI0025F64E3F|nr:hypothetical protein [uncultured Brevibacterium sp.]
MTEANPSLGITLPDSFTLDDIVSAIEQRRDTTIKILEFPEIKPEDGLFGIWLNTKFGDYVLHAPAPSELHRQQIILHELAHMILGHDLAVGKSSASELFPDLPENAVVRTLARGHDDNQLERDAESLADRLAHSLRRNAQQSSFTMVFG